MADKYYTKEEEMANAITHGFGVLFGIVSGIILLKLAMVSESGGWAVFSVSLYVFGMIASYLTSTLYHSCTNQKRRALLRKFDHAAIYFHIAGTYTPFTLVVLRNEGAWGWSLFCVVWLAALVGSILSFTHKKAGSKLETICYVVVGGVILIAFKPLVDALSATGYLDALYWLIAGGVSYIIGAIFYSFKIKYMHSVFHLFVLGGSICHVLAVMNIFR